MPDRDKLERLYHEYGSLERLAEARGWSRDNVRLWLKHHGIKTHNRGVSVAREKITLFVKRNRGKMFTLAQVCEGASVSLSTAKSVLIGMVVDGEARRVNGGFVGQRRGVSGRELREAAGWPSLEKYRSNL